MRHNWQGKRDGRPLPGAGRIGPNLTAMRLNSCTSHSQSQSTAARSILLLHTIEPVKDEVKMFRLNADTFISDAQTYLKIVALQTHGNSATIGRIFDGIIQQSVHNLLKTSGITNKHGNNIRKRERVTMMRIVFLPAFNNLLDQISRLYLRQ